MSTTAVTTISRRFEWDAAHRVLGHANKCRHLHGHRYVAEVILTIPQLNALGMVMDFGTIKELIGSWIDEFWDHNIILHQDDPLIDNNTVTSDNAAKVFGGKRPYIMPLCMNPTAENLAHNLYDVSCGLLIAGHFPAKERPEVIGVKVWETPNCWAQYSPKLMTYRAQENPMQIFEGGLSQFFESINKKLEAEHFAMQPPPREEQEPPTGNAGTPPAPQDNGASAYDPALMGTPQFYVVEVSPGIFIAKNDRINDGTRDRLVTFTAQLENALAYANSATAEKEALAGSFQQFDIRPAGIVVMAGITFNAEDNFEPRPTDRRFTCFYHKPFSRFTRDQNGLWSRTTVAP